MHESVKGNEYDALKTLFLDQVELLHRLTMVDLRIFSGYVTLQLAIGAWVAVNKVAIDAFVVKVGLMIIDLGLMVIATALLYNNRKRREEVISTVKNCNQALGYEDEGVYLAGKKLNAKMTTRSWALWYYVAIILGFIGVALIIAF